MWPDDWYNFIFSNSFSCMEKEVFAQYLVWCYRLNQSTHQSNSSNCSVLRKCVQYFLLEITKSLKDLERNEYEIFWSSLALFIRNLSPFIYYTGRILSRLTWQNTTKVILVNQWNEMGRMFRVDFPNKIRFHYVELLYVIDYIWKLI